MTRGETIALSLRMLGAAFNREITDALIQAYKLALAPAQDAEIALGTARALREHRTGFMPTPAELLAYAGHGPRNLAAEASEAWEAVRAAMDRHDYTKSVDFGPLVNAVVRNLGGWQWMCAQRLSDLVWRRKDFERVYAELAPKDPGQLRGDPLEGAFHGVPVRIAIAGLPAPLAIAAPPTRVGDVVRQLADAKSAVAPALARGPVEIPPRPRFGPRPPAPPMSDAEVAARKAELAAQLAKLQAAKEGTAA